MELDDLKSNWQQAGQGKKSQHELQQMTKLQHHPQLKKIRIKFIIEVVLLVGFLIVYNDFFDGSTKPMWANTCLVAGAGLLILADLAGFFTLRHPIRGSNLLASLRAFSHRLNGLAVLSVLASFLFGTGIILFFSASTDFTTKKYLLLAGMGLSLLTFTYWSYSIWKARILQIDNTVKELSKNPEL